MHRGYDDAADRDLPCFHRSELSEWRLYASMQEPRRSLWHSRHLPIQSILLVSVGGTDSGLDGGSFSIVGSPLAHQFSPQLELQTRLPCSTETLSWQWAQ